MTPVSVTPITSESAFTSAVQLMYEITLWSGYFSSHFLKTGAGQPSGTPRTSTSSRAASTIEPSPRSEARKRIRSWLLQEGDTFFQSL